MNGGRTSVSVVDDDPAIRKALMRMLTAAGLEVTVFGSAEEFLDSGAAARTACCIADIQLPGMSGFELLTHLKAEGGGTPPFIFITAYDQPALRADARDAGAICYFAKPFEGRELVAAIRKACEQAASPGVQQS